MQEEIKKLTNKIELLQTTLKYYTQLCTNLHKKTIQYDRITTRISLLKQRFLFIISFLQYCGDTSCVYGSILRKLFEFVFHFNTLQPDDTTADITNSDVNILLEHTNGEYIDKVKLSSYFYTLLHSLNTSRIFSEHVHNYTPSFANYKLTGIQYVNHTEKNGNIIPKAICYFKYKSDNMRVSVLAWKPHDIVDLNINQYMMTHSGIQSFYTYSFMRYLEHIYFKECQYTPHLDKIQQQAFPVNSSISKKEKLTHLLPLYSLLTHSYFKVLSSGYSLLNYGCIQFESDVDCYITGCKPPYPKLVLACNHSISLMAYKGILLSTSDTDTQAIRCPICRNDLKIYFTKINRKNNTLQYHPPKNPDITTLFQQKYSFISKDALEQI
jgi:hypothetical protein